VVARDETFGREEESREMGLKDYAEQGEFMKVHFIEKFTQPGEEISLYRNASLWILPGAACAFDGAGEGVQGDVGCGGLLAWRLRRISSWQRIYGTAFF